MVKRILYSIHRVLGTILSILFVVWFISGFVMIYHTFPKVKPADKYRCMSDLDISQLPSSDSVLLVLNKNEQVTKFRLQNRFDRPCIDMTTLEGDFLIATDTLHLPLPVLTYSHIKKYAQRWCDADIVKVESLSDLDQWIPFSRLRDDLPIYKFYFGDKDQHQLYVSSVTGEALQFTDSSSRLWSWLGPIPHWIYFTFLRQNGPLWSNVLIILSGAGAIMCIAGFVLAVIICYRQFRYHKTLKNPYRRFVYKWHLVLGFVFGIFVFTFVFSGMMSLATIPEWMVKVNNPSIKEQLFKPTKIKAEDYFLDCKKIWETFPKGIKSVEWTSFGDQLALYQVVVGDTLYTIDASISEVKPLELDEIAIKKRFRELHNQPMHISLMTAYDSYYLDLDNRLRLPVYKVEIEDEDKTTYYVDLYDGNTIYLNNNMKVRRWLYQGLHSFKFRFLADHTVWWSLIMWVAMLGGAAMSATGLWLGLRYIKRKYRKERVRKKRDPLS